MKVILSADKEDDLILALRAAKFLMNHPDRKDAILMYGEEPTTDFYVRRGKAAIIARPCYR